MGRASKHTRLEDLYGRYQRSCGVRPNPSTEEGECPEFFEWLETQDESAGDFSEQEWRALLHKMGLTEDQVQDYLEDMCGWGDIIDAEVF